MLTETNPASELKNVTSTIFNPSYDPSDLSEPFYSTPAYQIFNVMNEILQENIESIDQKIKIYTENSTLTSLFKLKDKITGSNLTEERVKLATEFQTKIVVFKSSLSEKISPDGLDVKIKELQGIIDLYQEKNNQLSTQHNKTGGRLETSFVQFKEDLGNLKSQTKPKESKKDDPDHLGSLKKIH